ncbi:putative oxidoreductase [Niallia circulans]|jgi:acrylyl-CoA reductase (NADPH)|uniref:acrylyl-CoA reductase family protein n=1 Tax=Niallia TaxID=2837506 RepID=UPI00077C5A42|nr:acryloyl-CoA reductase [Niallia circulans]MED3838462.1 acryloyl-CoA reductase [Niallia circulans]MED4243935.1 acryloyl-CoA reductase [Niallia circulans]MED4246329.1 acryloyl-CoA reductase [Niallia circulans]QKH63039.1 acryloyl-CoA reductase [Niallia circulans]SPT85020.1 putative oxidoreductase [Niallia circulans]
MKNSFQAVVVDNKDSNFSVETKHVSLEDLSAGEVVIKVHYSGVNYKDGLAGTPDGKIVRSYPHIPGIDMAGIVVSSEDSRFKEGDSVIATSYEIGVSHSGGYSEYARIPADWIVPLPEGLSLKEAMIIGTAGFTAALSIQRLQDNGLKPENGSVLVTGATGGVGSFGVAMLSQLGFNVIASSGKKEAEGYLTSIGASRVIGREDVYNGKVKALDKQEWAGAIDPVGGESLAAIISKIIYGGSVAVSGLTGGGAVPTSVFPFILRGVNLLGIDSVYCPMGIRQKLWERIATDLKPKNLSSFVYKEVSLQQLPEELPKILEGGITGRMIVAVE